MEQSNIINDIKCRIDIILETINKVDNFKVASVIKNELSKILFSLDSLNDPYIDFKEVVENLEETVFITDGKGNVLYVNSSYEKNTEIKPVEVLNRNVADILKEGTIFNGGVTFDVIEKGVKVSKLSTTFKTIPPRVGYVTGIPVFDNEGKIKLVVTSSRPITSFSSLQDDFERFVQEVKKTRVSSDIRILSNSKENIPSNSMIGSSSQMEHIWFIINKVADTDATVLITGESGVGKELVVNELHRLSKRHDKPFVKVNCASIPDSLLESELFGYEKGAFSGANTNGKPGLFELANSGTLLLDEIGDMPMELQAKLLRALQTKEIIRIGGTKPISLDIRIIASTNVKLKKKIEEGKFRSDLFYRLSVIPIHIAPLRDRISDIPELCNYFLEFYMNKYNRIVSLKEEHINLMKIYNWPGNIRELENIIEYLVILCSGEEEVSRDVLTNILNISNSKNELSSENFGLSETIESCEKSLIEKAVNCTKNLKEAGLLLKVDASTICRKIKKYNIDCHFLSK